MGFARRGSNPLGVAFFHELVIYLSFVRRRGSVANYGF
jgi:hypothetical protein